jgi:hypothetical protein
MPAGIIETHRLRRGSRKRGRQLSRLYKPENQLRGERYGRETSRRVLARFLYYTKDIHGTQALLTDGVSL